MALSLVTMRDFHGPFLKLPVSLHSVVHVRAAWTCMPTPARRAVACIHERKCERNKTMRAVDAVVSNLELTCQLLWASFQFTPRKWKSSVLLRNCSARTWTHAPFERWIGKNWAEPLPSGERPMQSDPKLGITYGAGQTKTLVSNGGTISNLMSSPSTEASSERCWSDSCDAGAGASVATRCSYSCAYLSLSLCVAVFLLDSVKVDNLDSGHGFGGAYLVTASSRCMATDCNLADRTRAQVEDSCVIRS